MSLVVGGDGPQAEIVAKVRRVAVRTGLQDLLGHVSARLADGRIVVTPGPAHSRPLELRPADLVTLPLDAAPDPSGGALLPPGIELDLALYRERPDVGSIVWASPPGAIAFGLAGRELLPIPISFAEFALAGSAFVEPERLRLTRQDGEAWARRLGAGSILHVRGVATVAVGADPRAALWATWGLEHLAEMSRLALGLSSQPRTMTAEDVGRIFGNMPAERTPSRDPLAYLPSLDRPPVRAVLAEPEGEADDPVAEIRRKVALSCRILAAQGDLVTFLEHVSHRVPGRDDVFAMSPSKDFSTMTAGDIGLVSTEGDCPPVDGPLPPAPFRWFHRDLLQARPDVEAIVHTHELHGRAFAAAGRRPLPVYRNGAREVRGPMPVFERASLVFSAEDRAGVLAALGDGPAVHELFHGTDFVAGSIEEATVAAVQREESLRLEAAARTLGEPAVLADSFIDDLAVHGPTAAQWWSYYASRLEPIDRA